MEEEKGESSSLLPRESHRKTKLTFWLVFSTAVCVGGSSFQFGYNTSCINSPEKVVKEYYKKNGHEFTDIDWAVAVSIFAVGGMVGAVLGPFLANHFGRKMSLFWNNFIAIFGTLLMFLSYEFKNPPLLMTGRFFIGVNSGINTGVVPMYLSEIAPIPLRGALGTMHQFGLVAGNLLGFILGLSVVLGNAKHWPLVVCFSFIPAIIQLMTLPWCPRSPRYLLLRLNQEEAAVSSLQALRGTTDVSDDIAEMREEQAAIVDQEISIKWLFTRKYLRTPLLIAVVLQCSQQLSGINAVFYYSTSILETANIPGSQYASVGVGLISIIMTALAVKLVEKFGRRPLMLWGLGGMIAFYSLMTISFRYQNVETMGYLAIVATLLLVSFFQLGPGPIPWFITAELFTQGPRPKACAIAATVNWFTNFLVGLSFPSMQSALYPYTFIVFIVLNLGFWLFVYFLVPETKGRSVEEISSQFKRGQDVYTYTSVADDAMKRT